ncbi:MAG: hypothetical protein R3F61_23170 [Myxococcota bacterium]
MEQDPGQLVLLVERLCMVAMGVPWLVVLLVAAYDLVKRPVRAGHWTVPVVVAALALLGPTAFPDPSVWWLFGARSRWMYGNLAALAYVSAGLLLVVRALQPASAGEPRPPLVAPDRWGSGLLLLALIGVFATNGLAGLVFTPVLVLGFLGALVRRGTPRLEAAAPVLGGLLVCGGSGAAAAMGVLSLTYGVDAWPTGWVVEMALTSALAVAGLVRVVGVSWGPALLAVVSGLPVVWNVRVAEPVEVELPSMGGLQADFLPPPCVVQVRADEVLDRLPDARVYYRVVDGRILSFWRGTDWVQVSGEHGCLVSADARLPLTHLPEVGTLKVRLTNGSWSDRGPGRVRRGHFVEPTEVRVVQVPGDRTVARVSAPGTPGLFSDEAVPLAELESMLGASVGSSPFFAVRVLALESRAQRDGPGPSTATVGESDPWTLQEGLRICERVEAAGGMCHLR